MLIEIVRINGDEPIAEDFVSGLKFATIAGENRVYDCFTEDEIIALDKQYNNLKETDGRYNGEKIDGYEILDDIIYFQQTQVGNETVRIYRLLADNRMIAEEIVFGLGRFYHQGKFYTFNGYREISFLYLQFYAE